MTYMLNIPVNTKFEEGAYENDEGETQCVTFVRKATTPNAPQTPMWRPGIRVQDARPGEILRGTAIATFDENGRYPTDKKGKHAAIYLSHTTDSIQVLDQWKGKRTVSQRPIRFNIPGKKRNDDGNTYYVIK